MYFVHSLMEATSQVVSLVNIDPTPPSPGGLGTFLPTGANFTPLTGFAPITRFLIGVGLAVMAVLGLIMLVFNGIKLGSNDQTKVNDAMTGAKRSSIMILAGLGGVMFLGAALSFLAAFTSVI